MTVNKRGQAWTHPSVQLTHHGGIPGKTVVSLARDCEEKNNAPGCTWPRNASREPAHAKFSSAERVRRWVRPVKRRTLIASSTRPTKGSGGEVWWTRWGGVRWAERDKGREQPTEGRALIGDHVRRALRLAPPAAPRARGSKMHLTVSPTLPSSF